MSSLNERPKSLWPNLGFSPAQKSPISIVKEQANQLAPQTQGIVEATVEVDRDEPWNEDRVDHTFSLSCPPLGGYSLALFFIRTQLVSLYPVRIWSNFLRDEGSNGTAEWKIENEDQLYEALEQILSNKKTISAIESMLAHAGAEPKKKVKAPSPSADADEVPF